MCFGLYETQTYFYHMGEPLYLLHQYFLLFKMHRGGLWLPSYSFLNISSLWGSFKRLSTSFFFFFPLMFPFFCRSDTTGTSYSLDFSRSLHVANFGVPESTSFLRLFFFKNRGSLSTLGQILHCGLCCNV